MHDLDLPDSLLAVARAGAGVNNIPLDKCADKGIVVFNTPGANANGVKELVFAGMLYASRDIVGGIDWCLANQNDDNIAKTAEKQKKNFAGTEISGKKLGVIGLGAIGVLVANAATHMGMEVYGYDPYISVNAAWNLSRSVKHISNVEDIYKECDYITIHVPLLDSTRKMIDANAIAMMKPTAIVLNFARDLLVDEEAMVDALAAGKIKKYVSDFPNTTTVGAKGCIVTPHLGASTAESEDNCAIMATASPNKYMCRRFQGFQYIRCFPIHRNHICQMKFFQIPAQKLLCCGFLLNGVHTNPRIWISSRTPHLLNPVPLPTSYTTASSGQAKFT